MRRFLLDCQVRNIVIGGFEVLDSYMTSKVRYRQRMAPDISGLSEISLSDSNPASAKQAYDRVRGESGTNYEFILYILNFIFPPP
jgi:hypothetical protein